jgi:hypothetical protein
MLSHDFAQEGDSVHFGHFYVEGNHVGDLLFDDFGSFVRVAGFANDLYGGVGADIGFYKIPDTCRIVNNEYFDGCG